MRFISTVGINRSGHLFQNRYKSILCQQDPYLLELVRYIHLNPFRAKIVSDLSELDRYPYSGHSRLVGTIDDGWQDTESVLILFAESERSARSRYGDFVQSGLSTGKRPELTGGGLVRSAGGWNGLQALRQMKDHMKSDERILGDSSDNTGRDSCSLHCRCAGSVLEAGLTAWD